MGSFVRDHLGAVSLSVLLHVALVMALVLSVSFGRTREVRAPVPNSVEVVMVDQDPAAVLAARREAEAVEQQRIEQARLESEREQQRQEQLRVERERQQREAAEQEAAERAAEAQRAEVARLELERVRQEEAQIAAEQAEQERREAEAAEQRRLEEERRRREEEARLAEERRLEEERLERERIERERQEEERRLAEQRRLEQERREQELIEQQLQEALLAEQEIMAARRSGEFDRYIQQIQAAINRAWIAPASARVGLECEVLVTQIPSGDVTSVSIGECNGDDAVRRSIEVAVRRASPLPKPSNALLFDRNLRVTFRPQL